MTQKKPSLKNSAMKNFVIHKSCQNKATFLNSSSSSKRLMMNSLMNRNSNVPKVNYSPDHHVRLPSIRE